MSSIPVLRALLVVIAFSPLLISAQTISGTGGYTPTFSLEVTPAVPAPFQSVRAEISSYSIDLDRATTTWFINDKKVFSGRGKKSYVVSAGDVGERTDIEVLVEDTRFGILTQSVTLIPIAIDLMWEAVGSYVPPFYKGKALPSLESEIKIIAIPYTSPNRDQASPQQFVYKWKKNDQYAAFSGQSGYGKNVLDFIPSIVDDNPVIGVDVSSYDKTFSGKNSIRFNMVSPFVRVYEHRPLEGVIYENSIEGDVVMKNNSISFIAEPYFFSAQKRSAAGLLYSWTTNGLAASSGGALSVSSNKSEETFSISVTVRNAARILQSAAKSFSASWKNDVTAPDGFIFTNQ